MYKIFDIVEGKYLTHLSSDMDPSNHLYYLETNLWDSKSEAIFWINREVQCMRIVLNRNRVVEEFEIIEIEDK